MPLHLFFEIEVGPVSVTLDPGEEISTVRLEGELGIGTVRELKEMLVGALASGKRLQIELAGATVWDVTIYQLLWAAQREAKKYGARFHIEGPIAECIVLATGEAGLAQLTTVAQ